MRPSASAASSTHSTIQAPGISGPPALDRTANEPDGGLRLLVLRGHQRTGGSGPSSRHHVSATQSGYEWRSAASGRALGKRFAEVARAVREPPEHRIGERHRPLEPRLPHELDRLVDGRVARHAVHERELVRAESERVTDGPSSFRTGRLPSVSIAWSSVRAR